MMGEWQQQQQIIHQNLQNPEEDDGTRNGNGGLFVKVMTDGQMGQLRQQIAVYTTICDQLVDLHKQLSAQQDLTGRSRQRWTPSPVQLKILEQIFEEGNGTPCKQKIKELTMELAQHGQISETNVYHWFQNRRARSKRKQSMIAQNNAEPEVESPRDEKTKPEDILSFDNSALRAENIYLQSPELGFGNFDW